MICKASEYENGYVFMSSSNDKDLQEIFSTYKEVRCIICNENTVRNFKLEEGKKSIITINKRVADGCFFINRIC